MKKLNLLFWLGVAVSLFLSLTLFPGCSGGGGTNSGGGGQSGITGSITRVDGAGNKTPVPGMKVELFRTVGDQFVGSTFSGADGKFTIEDPAVPVTRIKAYALVHIPGTNPPVSRTNVEYSRGFLAPVTITVTVQGR